MKFLALICVLFMINQGLVNCGEKIKSINDERIMDEKASEKLQKALDSLPVDKIPSFFKAATKDDSHWCCKVDPPVMSYEQTRVMSYEYINSENRVCGYSSCGLFGWSSCSVWCTVYWSEIRYYTEHYTVYQQQPCPASSIICCQDYFLIHGHCFHITEVQSNLDLLAALNNQGIVLPPGK